MSLSTMQLQAFAKRALDGLTTWAESTAAKGDDAAAVAAAGLRLLDDLARELRAAAGSPASEDRGPAHNDAHDMSKGLERRKAGLPVRTTWTNGQPDPKPHAPPGFWGSGDLSADLAAKKQRGKKG